MFIRQGRALRDVIPSVDNISSRDAQKDPYSGSENLLRRLVVEGSSARSGQSMHFAQS